MSDEPQLTTRDMGEAENALRALLLKILAQSDQKLEYGQWVALQIISKSPAPVGPPQVSGQLVGALKVSAEEADTLLGGLQDTGILEIQNDAYVLSANGQAVFSMLSAQVRDVTAQAFAGLDPADLVAAHRVVVSITKRANEILAS